MNAPIWGGEKHQNQLGAWGPPGMGVKLHGTKIVNMLSIQIILPWVIRSKKQKQNKTKQKQKNQLHEIHTMFCSCERDQNNNRLLTSWVKFSS